MRSSCLHAFLFIFFMKHTARVRVVVMPPRRAQAASFLMAAGTEVACLGASAFFPFLPDEGWYFFLSSGSVCAACHVSSRKFGEKARGQRQKEETNRANETFTAFLPLHAMAVENTEYH